MPSPIPTIPVVLPPDIGSMADAARMLGVTESTARRLARLGQFPGDAAFRVGRQWRFSIPRLQKFLNGEVA